MLDKYTPEPEIEDYKDHRVNIVLPLDLKQEAKYILVEQTISNDCL